MALVLHLSEGDVFNVAHRRFVLSHVKDEDACVLQELGEGELDVSRSKPTCSGGVAFQISDGSTGLSPRLAISAPPEQTIWRRGGVNKSDVALLAPVPEGHLESALVTCEDAGRVAFGSRAWQAFAELDRRREWLPCDVYIYPSHSELFGTPKVRWVATYVRQLGSRGGRHPDRYKFRPTSTHESEDEGHWSVFWEVTDLRRLDPADAVPMNRFQGVDKSKRYVSNFKPEGPLLVEPIEL